MNRAVRVLGLAAILYSLTGFFIVPVVVTNLTPCLLPADTGWSLAIGNTSFNPYTLALSLHELTIAPRPTAGIDPEQPPVTIDLLHLELDPASLVERALLSRKLTISGLFMHLIRQPLREGQDPPRLGVDLGRLGTKLPYALRNITVRDSELIFEDNGSGIYQRAENIYLALPLLTNRPDRRQPPPPEQRLAPGFSATINGTSVGLNAAGRPDPEQPTPNRFDLDFQDIDLPTLLDSLPLFANLEIARGLVDLNLAIVFPPTFAAGNVIEIRIEGQVRDLQVYDARGCEATVGRGSFRLKFQPLSDAYQLEDLTLDNPHLACPGNWQLTATTLRTSDASRQPGQLELGKIRGTGVTIYLASELLTAARPPPTGSQAVTVQSLDLREAVLVISRGAVPDEAGLRFGKVEIHGSGLTGNPDRPGTVTIAGALTDTGRIDCQGQMTVFPLTARLNYQAENLPFAPFQPLLSPFIQPTMTAAALSGTGQLSWPALTITGSAAVTTINNIISPQRDFFFCPTTTLNDFRLTLAPPALTIAELNFINPQFAMARTERKQPGLAAFLLPVSAAAPPTDQPRIAVTTLRLTEGTVTLTDHTAMPTLVFEIATLNSELSGVTNQPGPTVPFTLQGTIALTPDPAEYPLANPASPARLAMTGQVALFGASPALQAVLAVDDFDLLSLGPYLAPLLGYQPDRGSLALAADLDLRNQQLTSRNRFTLKKFQLGASSSGRFNTPLTVALLTGVDRTISLEMEVRGDLKQPAFSYSATLAGRIRQILTRTTSAPFSLVTTTGNRPEVLEYFVFPAGSAKLDRQPAAQLANLASVLRERPLLKLSIAGWADPAQDLQQTSRATSDPAPAPDRILMELARRRGEAIREGLIRTGIAGNRLHLEEPTATPDEDILLDRPAARADITPRL